MYIGKYYYWIVFGFIVMLIIYGCISSLNAKSFMPIILAIIWAALIYNRIVFSDQKYYMNLLDKSQTKTSDLDEVKIETLKQPKNLSDEIKMEKQPKKLSDEIKMEVEKQIQKYKCDIDKIIMDKLSVPIKENITKEEINK